MSLWVERSPTVLLAALLPGISGWAGWIVGVTAISKCQPWGEDERVYVHNHIKESPGTIFPATFKWVGRVLGQVLNGLSSLTGIAK